MRTCFDVILAGRRETEGGGRGEGDQLQEGGWRHTLELRMTCDQLWFWHQSIDCHWPLGDSCSAHSAPPPSPKQDPVWGSEWRFINWAPPRLCTQWDTVPAPTESILWRGREMDIDDHLKKTIQFYWPDKYKSVHTHTLTFLPELPLPATGELEKHAQPFGQMSPKPYRPGVLLITAIQRGPVHCPHFTSRIWGKRIWGLF